MGTDSYNNRCLTKIDQFLNENGQLPPCWRTRFVETHLRLLKVFVCYTRNFWSDEDNEVKHLGSLPAELWKLEAQLLSNDLGDYVARFVLPEPVVDSKNDPRLWFPFPVSLNFQANTATTFKYLLSLETRPSPISDVAVFSQFADSVRDYLVSLRLELEEHNKLSYFHGIDEVEQKYNDSENKLGLFRSFISTLAEAYVEEKELRNLLDRARALVLRVATVACDNQIIDRHPGDYGKRMVARSRYLFEIIPGHFEALCPPSRRPLTTSMITFEDLVESYANLYQMVENEVNIPPPAVFKLCSNPMVQYFTDELKLLFRQEVSAVFMKARSFIGCSSPGILPSKFFHKMNLIKAEVFVLELHNQKTNVMIPTDDKVVTIGNAFKCLSIFFKTPEVYMDERDKSIVACIEALLREEAAGSLFSLDDQSILPKLGLKIFVLFKAATKLLILIDNKASSKFLERYCLEILQKSLIFLRGLLDQADGELFAISEPVIREAINLVIALGCFSDRREGMKLLPDSFPRMVELNMAEIGGVYLQCPWLLISNFPKSDGHVFVDSLLRNMDEFLEGNPSQTVVLLKYLAKVLLQELQVLHSFIKKIKQKNGNRSEDLGDGRIPRLFYEAEYIITNLFEDGYFPVWYKQLVLLNAIVEAKITKSEIEEYHLRDKEERHHGTILNVLQQTSERSNNQGPDEVIVGFEDQAKYIEDQLKASSPERQIISIVGMGGSGKTTLAKKVYNSLSIQRHFWVRAWCTVSQVYRKRELLLEILECVVEITEEIKRKDDDDVADTLRKKLKGKRYLVVIDDIWSKDAWNDLRLSLPNDAKGSRILFTSRNFEVALERELYRLPLLTVEESWLLFEEKLFHGGKCPKELLEVGRLIVENCKGLPLAIIVMAGLLEKVEKRKDRWEEIGRTSMSRTARDDGDNQIMHMLALSYNHLPSHLKPCFLYFGMFLEDQQVPVQKLKWLWIAEGFVPKEDSKSLEETAEEYLVELIGRNLVLEAQSRSRGGSKTCQVHDMVRYLCLKKAREENFMHRIMDADFRNPGSSCSYPVSSSYRLSFQPDLEWHWFQFIETRVRSLLVFPSHGYKLDGRTVEWPNSKFLRVLDAEQLQLSDIKFEKFELLRCIKYLAVRGSFYSVPSSIIVQLFNLETLILKGDPLGNHVSTELWRMRKLRHVHIKAISHSSLPGPHEIEDLGNIVTLSLLTIKDPSSVEKFLKSLIGVKKLKCQFIRDGDTDRKSCVTPAMDTLHQLVSLHLSCYSIAHMITFPSNFRFPINLKKLTLRRFRLPLKSVSAIGQQLRNLEVLKIMYCYEMDSTWDMEEDEFRKLTYLKICAFGFRIWNASSDSFPQLERLVLQDCPKLEEIPISFGDISSLQMIEVKNCRESACKSVEAIYKQQLDWGNEKFKVSITGMLDDEETSESEDDDDEYDGWLN